LPHHAARAIEAGEKSGVIPRENQRRLAIAIEYGRARRIAPACIETPQFFTRAVDHDDGLVRGGKDLRVSVGVEVHNDGRTFHDHVRIGGP